MKNEGHPPDAERVDIKFRNGQVRRGIEPGKWRWKPWEWGASAWDIVEWQPVG